MRDRSDVKMNVYSGILMLVNGIFQPTKGKVQLRINSPFPSITDTFSLSFL